MSLRVALRKLQDVSGRLFQVVPGMVKYDLGLGDLGWFRGSSEDAGEGPIFAGWDKLCFNDFL